MAFDEESTSYPLAERSHVMSSLTETTKRSKKMKRLGPVLVIRPEHYEAFDVNSKLECIHVLIPYAQKAHPAFRYLKNVRSSMGGIDRRGRFV